MSLRAAFEDILSDENLINPVTDMSETEISEVLEEVQESANEVGKTEELVEALEEESAALESIIQAVNANEDGMTKGEAVLFHHALESICRRLYIQEPTRLVPAVESFGEGQDRIAATLESADGAKNILVRMYEAIKAAILKMYNSVKDFFKSFGKGVEALRAGILKLRKRADEATSAGKTAAGKIKIAGYANNLSIDGKFDKGIITGDHIGTRCRDALANVTAARKKILAEMISIRAASDVDAEERKKAIEEAVLKEVGVLSMPGGYKMVASFGRFTLKQEPKDWGAEEIDGFAPADIGRLCGKIEMIVKYLDQHNKDVEANTTAVNNAVNQAKTLVNAEGAIAKTKLKLTEMNARWAVSGIAQVPSRVATVAKTLIAFGNANVGAAKSPTA